MFKTKDPENDTLSGGTSLGSIWEFPTPHPHPPPPPLPRWIRWPWLGESGLRLRRFNVLHSASKCYRSALLNVAEKLRSLPNIYRTVLRCRRPVSVPAIHSSVTRIRLGGGSDFPCVLPKLHVSKLDSVNGRHPESGRTVFMGAGAKELGDLVGFGKHRIYSCGGNISQGFRVSHMRLVSAVILSRAGLILLGEMGEERRGGERKEWGGREGGGMEEGEVGGRKGRDWGKRGREGREGGREGGGREDVGSVAPTFCIRLSSWDLKRRGPWWPGSLGTWSRTRWFCIWPASTPPRSRTRCRPARLQWAACRALGLVRTIHVNKFIVLCRCVDSYLPRFTSSHCQNVAPRESATHFDHVMYTYIVNKSPHNGKPLSICFWPQSLEVKASKHELMASAPLSALLFTTVHPPIRNRETTELW